MRMRDRDTNHDPDDPHWQPEHPKDKPGRGHGPDEDPNDPPVADEDEQEDDCND